MESAIRGMSALNTTSVGIGLAQMSFDISEVLGKAVISHMACEAAGITVETTLFNMCHSDAIAHHHHR